jgi:tetratricopeptide (TPR) repeat protein
MKPKLSLRLVFISFIMLDYDIFVKFGLSITSVLKKTIRAIYFLFGSMLILAFGACSTEQNGLAGIGMQNLTAKYNLLFNARELLKESERNTYAAYRFNFNQFLPVFIEPDVKMAQSELKRLDEVIAKSNRVANEKGNSSVVDEAYLLIGQANHYKANHFNAVEFFQYVYQFFPAERENRQLALIWKARSLMESKRLEEAESAIDTAIKYLKNAKRYAAEAHACRAKLFIIQGNYTEAAKSLTQAVKLTSKKEYEIRWTYLLAQLEQKNGNLSKAYDYYSKIVDSNAPFEMAFNANLNRISIETKDGNQSVNKAQKLSALLKDEKNLELTDQIYYQLGRHFEEIAAQDKAVENYNISLRKNSRNQDQRGLSYWALAELYFKQANFVEAKKYYDSTLNALPPSHPEFELIKKKNENLDLLAKNLSIIAEEDTLQILARLSEKDRDEKIDQILLQKIKPQGTGKLAAVDQTSGNIGSLPNQANNSGSRFYFDNPAALSQGFSDFKRRWGNRVLEDNWRISQKSASTQNNQTFSVADTQSEPGAGLNASSGTEQELADLKKTYLKKIPKTPEDLAASNLKIADAYFEVGTYYREVLNMNSEAIMAFETLLKRAPTYENRFAVYYNLYRLYAESATEKANAYKNKILEDSPNSVYAKVILDPEYSEKQDQQDRALTEAYEKIFEIFSSKRYEEMQSCIREAEMIFGSNRLSAQLAYLNAIALGHLQSLAPFEVALKSIIKDFPDEKLVNPLVKQHLEFIEANRKTMIARKFALFDKDPNNLIWAHELLAEMEVKPEKKEEPPSKPIENTEIQEAAVEVQASTVEIQASATETKASFNLKDDTYYFVIKVANGEVNLSSSRFGIGQFNRANFEPGTIKHLLLELDAETQLIYVGEFDGREAAKSYYSDILPLMNDIMKIPAEEYSLFIITKANFEQIKDKNTLNQYFEFYQKNYK